MPRQFIPRDSGPHRIACKLFIYSLIAKIYLTLTLGIALYRGLLEQCPRIPLPADIPYRGAINPIKHLIRKRFKRNVSHTSPRLVVAALKAGYKVCLRLTHSKLNLRFRAWAANVIYMVSTDRRAFALCWRRKPSRNIAGSRSPPHNTFTICTGTRCCAST